MRRVLPICLLLICLVVASALGGCLFGKKGGDEEGGEVGVERYSLELVKDLLNQIAESAGFEEDDGYEAHCNAYRD